MNMNVSKNEKKYSVSLDSNQDADILFQNLNECKELFSGKFDYVVCAIPFCNESFELRQLAYKHKNHYGHEKFFLMDSEPDGYLAHRSNGLALNKICSTQMLAEHWFTSQGFDILD